LTNPATNSLVPYSFLKSNIIRSNQQETQTQKPALKSWFEFN